jgi:predicted permease
VLLIGAGLLVRTLRNLEQVELGFNKENLLLFTLNPRANDYKGEQLERLYRQVFARLDNIPGVRSATFARVPLIAWTMERTPLILPGETAQTDYQIARENYFETMEIPLLRGRSFTPQDDGRATRVAIISESLAQSFFANEDPIGKLIGFDAETAGKVEIIGIARDIKYNSIKDEKRPLLYLPWLQMGNSLDVMQFALRTSGDPTSLVNAARQAVREVDGNLPLVGIKTMESHANEMLMQERVYADLLSFFAALALLLAAVGLYGVMAYSVAQRTREIGIRMALGAQKGEVLRLLTGEGMKLVLIGSAIGMLASFWVTRVIESRLYGVTATDPPTFAASFAVLMLIALIACWVPARRAAKVDPMKALHHE